MSVRTMYVRYIDHEEEEGELAFKCLAEDDSHAREQCENAYPGCQIIAVEVEHWLYSDR